jgi:hypothetical protein
VNIDDFSSAMPIAARDLYFFCCLPFCGGSLTLTSPPPGSVTVCAAAPEVATASATSARSSGRRRRLWKL